MHEFVISATGRSPTEALAYGRRLSKHELPRDGSAPVVLAGEAQLELASIAAWEVANGGAIVLQPTGITSSVALAGAGGQVRTWSMPPSSFRAGEVDWRVAMYSSGSMRTATVYGFTKAQLNQLTAWYTDIYQVTSDSVICTQLPVSYNFAFIAGVCLSGALGARLHLASSIDGLFDDARRLAGEHDRCVILGNPLLVAGAPGRRLPDNVLVDCGGAALSVTAVKWHRESVADLREGYGLTETGSLTHFDSEASQSSLGTVGRPLPGVTARIAMVDGRPRVAVTTPVAGVAIDNPPARRSDADELLTSDLGVIDSAGRLRILGRSDDHMVNGLWPRDTLDLIGPVLGSDSALIRHPAPDAVLVRLHRAPSPGRCAEIRDRISTCTKLPPAAITIDVSTSGRLHSDKLPRVLPNDGVEGGSV